MITANYINALREQVDRANERFELNPTRENEFILTLLVTSLEARLRSINRTEHSGVFPTDDSVCRVEPCRAYQNKYMGED